MDDLLKQYKAQIEALQNELKKKDDLLSKAIDLLKEIQKEVEIENDSKK